MGETEVVIVEKLVHGGQALGVLADGRRVFVWNALPGERVRVRMIKKKRSYAEAIAEEVLEVSPDRIDPVESNYLATSPWQIMTMAGENRAKSAIVAELFQHEKVVISTEAQRSGEISSGDSKEIRRLASLTQDDSGVVTVGSEFRYRNKMEYSFWGDEAGLHLALHQRGSHGKQIVAGSALAMPAVDAAANAVLAELQRLGVRASDLKTVIVRCDQNGNAAASLFVKPSEFPRLNTPSQVKSAHHQDGPGEASETHFRGLRVYHSIPKSPASVRTQLLYEIGDCRLSDTLLGREFHYDVDTFFQVNLPVYQKALASIKQQCQADPVDMYAGVGTIGLSVSQKRSILVELDPATAAMARENTSQMSASGSVLDATVVEASTENALEYITGERPVIFDPPRAGLHGNVVERCLEVLPPQIIYLSCNPATQARDLALLQAAYKMTHIEIFNFFPRTPHIEPLAVLERK